MPKRLEHLHEEPVRHRKPRARIPRAARGSLESEAAYAARLTRNPEQLLRVLGADNASKARVVKHLQKAGNASVQRILRRVRYGRPILDVEPEPERSDEQTESHEFAATIPHGPPPEREDLRMPVPALSDAEPGGETHVERAQLAPFIEAPREYERPAPEPGHEHEEARLPSGVSIPMPDIVIPELELIKTTDAIAGVLGYEGEIKEEAVGLAASEFGVTEFGGVKLSKVTVTPDKGTFRVTATAEHKIKWEVRADTGPRNQKDIESQTDRDITDGNFPDVVADLTPNMRDLNGRPRRKDFWTKDLTIKHEKFHAEDAKKNGPASVEIAKAWLQTKTAGTVADVDRLLLAVPGRVVDGLVAAMAFPAVEERAYGDGANDYSSRAKAIEKLGLGGKYK